MATTEEPAEEPAEPGKRRRWRRARPDADEPREPVTLTVSGGAVGTDPGAPGPSAPGRGEADPRDRGAAAVPAPRTAAPPGETPTASGTTMTPRKAAPAAEILTDTDDGTSTKEKAERPPAAWDNFAPAAPPEPGLAARIAQRTTGARRVLGHEWTLAVLAGLALSLLVNNRLLADPRHTLPQDIWDPSLVAYLISWGGHALLHDPANLWHLNAFYPAPYGLAFSDSLLGYAPFAFVGTGPEAAVLRYNLIYIGAEALVVTGAYALVRQLGLGRVGAALAAVAFAVAPWRLAQAGHLHVLSTGGVVLALAMLARGHGIRWRSDVERGPHRAGWALAGWVVAAWQLTIGFGIGLVFAYVLLGAVVVGCVTWAIRRRPLPARRLLLADLAGGLLFAATAYVMSRPYLRVLELVPGARRTDAWIQIYSPTWRSYLTAPPTSVLWGDLHARSVAQLRVPGEMTLLPGFALYAFAVAGLVFSVWSVRVRLALLAGTVVSIVLGVGTNGPRGGQAGYLLLLHYVPGFEGLRTPGRLVIWTTLLLALLAAGAACALVVRAQEAAHRRGLPAPSGPARLALLIPVLLVLVEGWGSVPQPRVPPAPAVLSTVEAPYLVLPSDEVGDMPIMLWSTDRFADLVNGGSGVLPPQTAQVREAVRHFPDQASVEYLRGIGVRTVVVLPDRAAGTPWADPANLPVSGLGMTVEATPEAVVFHLTS